MLFNPTPLERLTTLTAQLIEKHASEHDELKVLREEISTLRAANKSQEDEITKLNKELLEKDIEIEAIVSKIESLLG